MTIVQLQYFQVLAHTLHFTKSAEKLSISQPSLSYAINELEKELGVALIKREKKSIQLTEYGTVFLPYVEETLRMLKSGCDAVRKLDTDTPHIIRIGYIHSLSTTIVPKIVEGFLHENENRNIRIQFAEDTLEAILKQLKEGQLDCILTPDYAPSMKSIPVMRQSLYLAVAVDHPLAQRDSVRLDEFLKEPQIMLNHSSNLRSKLDKVYENAGIQPNIVFEVKECNTALQYVGMKFGVAVLPEVPVMNSGKVKAIPIHRDDVSLSRLIYFVYNDELRSKPMEAFCDFVEKKFRYRKEDGE